MNLAENAVQKQEKYHCLKKGGAIFNIGYGIDDNYARCCGASLASVCANNESLALAFHIVAHGISEENKRRFRALSEKFCVNITLYETDAKYFAALPTKSHFPPSIYYRYMLPQLVKNTDRVLYLDADIICLQSLKELQTLDFADAAAAAVPDVAWMGKKRGKAFNLTGEYFNSGVMLLNLKKWQELSVYEKSKELLTKNPKLYRYPDQDVLNIILEGKVCYLAKEYNAIDLGEIDKDAIKLLHYAAHPKPWSVAWQDSPICNEFNGALYEKYESLTPWQGAPPQLPSNNKDRRIYAESLIKKGQYLSGLKWYFKYLQKKYL